MSETPESSKRLLVALRNYCVSHDADIEGAAIQATIDAVPGEVIWQALAILQEGPVCRSALRLEALSGAFTAGQISEWSLWCYLSDGDGPLVSAPPNGRWITDDRVATLQMSRLIISYADLTRALKWRNYVNARAEHREREIMRVDPESITGPQPRYTDAEIDAYARASFDARAEAAYLQALEDNAGSDQDPEYDDRDGGDYERDVGWLEDHIQARIDEREQEQEDYLFEPESWNIGPDNRAWQQLVLTIRTILAESHDGARRAARASERVYSEYHRIRSEQKCPEQAAWLLAEARVRSEDLLAVARDTPTVDVSGAMLRISKAVECLLSDAYAPRLKELGNQVPEGLRSYVTRVAKGKARRLVDFAGVFGSLAVAMAGDWPIPAVTPTLAKRDPPRLSPGLVSKVNALIGPAERLAWISVALDVIRLRFRNGYAHTHLADTDDLRAYADLSFGSGDLVAYLLDSQQLAPVEVARNALVEDATTCRQEDIEGRFVRLFEGDDLASGTVEYRVGDYRAPRCSIEYALSDPAASRPSWKMLGPVGRETSLRSFAPAEALWLRITPRVEPMATLHVSAHKPFDYIPDDPGLAPQFGEEIAVEEEGDYYVGDVILDEPTVREDDSRQSSGEVDIPY